MAYGESLSATNGQSAAKLRRLFKMYLITKEKYLQNLQNRFPDDNNINTILDNIFKKFNDQSQDVEKN